MNVFGYELLFRSGFKNVFDGSDADQATSSVINNSFFTTGMPTMTGGKKAFINFTRDIILREYATLLPKDSAVIELLENIEPEPDIIDACRRLRDSGYTLALDDFVYDPKYEPLLELAHIVKVDFMISDLAERKKMADRFLPRGIKLLAEKVETLAEFEQAKEMGYSYFQGYFFSKPTIVTGTTIPESKIAKLSLLQEVSRMPFDFNRVESVVKRDVSFSYKLLKMVNSSAFGLRQEVRSIKQALVLLGEKNVRKWASLVTMACMGDDKPAELVLSSVIRGKFFENMAPLVGFGGREQDMFLLGLFSLIDAITDQPMTSILSEIPLVDDVKQVLLGSLPGRLSDTYDTLLAYEGADWDRFITLGNEIKLDESKVPPVYTEAIEWGHEIMAPVTG
jgi:EAL and modified HD-GYP domain-containing signal transduction protein